MSEGKPQSTTEASSTLARSGDGTIQITFSIPFSEIAKLRLVAAKELGEKAEIPGFRPGKAPIEKIIEHIPSNTLLEKTLAKILPKLFADAVEKHSLKPAIYPKFELIKAKENEDWEVRAVTCEISDIDLGDYKKELADSARTKSIWTPGSEDGASAKEKTKTQTREEKEQLVIKILLEKVKIILPKVLIDEEVNSRLSQLLARIEKLGLNLESYLSSLGKTAQNLREDYEKQAHDALTLDLILGKIAEVEKMTVDEKEIEAAVNAGKADPKLAQELNTPERRRLIESILKRRKVLDYLVTLI